MDLLVRGRYLILSADEKNIVTDGAVLVRDGRIFEIGAYSRLRSKHQQADEIGNGRQLLMPGLIDGHSHGEGLTTIQRGMTFDFLENGLIDWAFLFEIDPELSAALSGARHLANGCTTIHHNYWGEEPNKIENAEKVIRGYSRTGIRLAYSPGGRNINALALNEKGFLSTLPENLKDFARQFIVEDKSGFVDRYLELFDELYARYNGDNIRILFGPSWVQGCTPEFLKRVKQHADSLGKVQIHLHALQTPIQKAYALKHFGKSMIGYLEELGMLDSNLTLGHAVYITERDIELLADHDVSVTHHPSCNLTVRNGIAPIYFLHRAGVNVALGIDDKGFNDDDDPFTELRMIYKLHRIASFDLKELPLSASDVFNMGTINAARVCGYTNETGIVKPGMAADLVLVDLEEISEDPWLFPDMSMIEALIQRGLGRHVNTVIVGGQLVIEDRKVLSIDIQDIFKQARKAAAVGLSAEQHRFASKLSRLKPYIQSWYADWPNLEMRPFYVLNSKV
jgi:5-methylthioadenosine/S-adenosylhomocysteine deaminase